MIEIKEIRIGNYVQYNGSLIAIYAISELEIQAGKTFHINTYQSYELEPIPLTPEILSACGYIPEPDFGKFENVTARGIFTVNFKNNGFQMDNHFEIKFLHQLQNYHFCIYGTELEYKP